MEIIQTIVQILQYIFYILKVTLDLFLQFCNYIKLNEYIIPFFIKLFVLTIICSLVYATIFVVRQWIKSTFKKSVLTQEVYLRVQKIASYTILAIGSMIALQNIGIQVTPIITLLGIIGVALGYALRDFISDIIAGLLILTYQPFKINDYIKIKVWQGKIVDISIRCTTLQEDNMLILVPNSILYTRTVAIILQNTNEKK